MTSANLINELVECTQEHLNRIQQFRPLALEVLNYRSSEQSWSILECIEHLNRYGAFYLPEIQKQLEHSKFEASETFQPGWLGNYFVNLIRPKEKLKQMKTMKDMDPLGSHLDKTVLDEFTRQQQAILQLLDQARKVDLRKTKTAVSITSWIKLRLGDTLRFLIYHNTRHLLQAEMY